MAFLPGVVIGAWRMPSAVALQNHVLQTTCPGVPLLINEGCAGHAKGDLSKGIRGIEWACRLDLTHLALISQRFVLLEPGWLELAHKALKGRATLSQGTPGFPIRSEFIFIDVKRWRDKVHLLHHRGNQTPGEWYWASATEQVDRGYVRWEYIPRRRTDKRPYLLWRQANSIDDYKRVYPVGEDFHIDDWQKHGPYTP